MVLPWYPRPGAAGGGSTRTARRRPHLDVLVVSPTQFRVVGPYPAMQAWRETLAVDVPGAQYSTAFRKGNWDGRNRPGRMRKVDGVWGLELGRGLLERFLEDNPDSRLHVAYDPPPPMDPQAHMDPRLFDHQREAVEEATRRRWGRVWYATNAGKGAVIATLAEAARPSRTLILADEVSVFDALVGEVEEWGDGTPGMVAAGCGEPPADDVVVAMVPTLEGRIKDLDVGGMWEAWLRTFALVLLDEADRATSKRWQRVLAKCESSEWRVGFSGSFPDPDKPENGPDLLKLDETVGPELARIQNMELVEQGISARPTVQLVRRTAHLPPKPDTWRKMSGPDRRSWVYRHAVTHNRFRNELVRDLIVPGERTTVVVERTDHGEILEQVIPDSAFIHGTHPYRDQILRGFRDGAFSTLIATRILDRGSNLLGRANALILASGEGSPRQVLQRIGRVLRRGGGKATVRVVDIMDRGHDYLDDAGQRRLEVYEDEGFDIHVMDETEVV